MPVEALFPEGGSCFELASSGRSWVLGIDAVGGAPHGDFADEGAGVIPVLPKLAGHHCGRRDPGPGRRGRRPVGIASPGRPPRRDDHGALMECPAARGADLGREA